MYTHEEIYGFIGSLAETFGERLFFAGLQGSYGRGEPSESSDVDIVAVLDSVNADDIGVYRRLAEASPMSGMLCGFICGVTELEAWERSDLFLLIYDTLPVIGNLDYLKPSINADDVRRAVLTGACGTLHACRHCLLYGGTDGAHEDIKKQAFFTMRTRYFAENGVFIKAKRELLPLLSDRERAIFSADGADVLLITAEWASELVASFGT